MTSVLEPVPFLIVDDLPENLLALEALLRRDGLLVLKARSGTEALEILLKHDVALALVDVQMPAMDGFELAELMRGMDRTRRVPIIFLTAGNADRQRRFRGYETGAVDFLHKPIEPDVLRSKTDVFFELYRQRQEVAMQRDELRAATDENSRLLQESRQYAAELKEADRRKDEFLAMLAHELRNPLAPVRNAVEILRLSGPVNEAIESAREILSRQVAHMARLIDDLLDVARIARGKVRLRTERCDLAELVRQTAEDYRPTLVAIGVTFKIDVPTTQLPLMADPTRVAQVIGNLLHNAGKFTPRGGVVTVEVDEEMSGNGGADRVGVVRVSDTGAGLDATVMAHLFEPFSQADQPIDRHNGGLGLGLALVKGLLELHGGSVGAESAGPNQGSTFTMRIPLVPAEPEVDESKNTGGAKKNTCGMRILIVEDNADAAKSLQMLLKFLGHTVETAPDGTMGLEAARSFHPNVVISDLGLPGKLDGYALAQAIRADAELRTIHLIAMSGYGADEDRQRTKEAGFDQHLVKPVDIGRLKESLSRIAL
jgi:signal transduction histidine kinase